MAAETKEAKSEELDLSKIDIGIFCDLNGVNDSDRQLMGKIYKGVIKSYDQWHEDLSKDFKLHEKKDFNNKKK